MSKIETITVEIPARVSFHCAKAETEYEVDMAPLADKVESILKFAFGRKAADKTGAATVGKKEAVALCASLLAGYADGNFASAGARSVPLWVECIRELADKKGLVPKGETVAKAIPAGGSDTALETVFGSKWEAAKAWAIAEAKRRSEVANIDLDELLG